MKKDNNNYNLRLNFIKRNYYRFRFVIIPFIVSFKYRIFPLKNKISKIKVITNGLKFLMKIDTDGKGKFPVINTLLLRILGMYEPETSLVLSSEIRKGDIVLEIGAAYGYFTAQISQLVGNKGRVISIEPSSHMNTVCADTIRLNNLNNVDLLAKAMTPRDKKIDFLNLYETISFDTLIELYKINKIDFIFIDIDSSSSSGDELRQELALLQDILPVLKSISLSPKIFLEYVENGSDFDDIYALFQKFKYSFIKITKRHYLFTKELTK